MKRFTWNKNKRSISVVVDGIKFSSISEGTLYQLLKLKYEEIYCQPKIYLSKAQILYKPDFMAGEIYFEMKGFETAVWRIKRRLWKHYGPGPLHVYKMKGHKPYLFEVISPEPCYE